MTTTTKVLLIGGGVVLAYLLFVKKSATGTSLLGMPKPSSGSSVWDNAGKFFGSTFKSWFGSSSTEPTQDPASAATYAGMAAMGN